MKRLLPPLLFCLILILSCKNNLQKITVDCTDLSPLLADILKADQGIRQGKDVFTIDMEEMMKTDLMNLGKVVSILEQCGMPTSKEVDIENIQAIFLVLQHSEAKYQKQYLPMLEESADAGDLSQGAIAMMKDRISISEGKPQIYGTQLITDRKTDALKLYNLADPEYVDKRRREVGLGPIQEYLEAQGIEFTTEQKE